MISPCAAQRVDYAPPWLYGKVRARRGGRNELIEQALFFAIGFLAALLAAVVALPVVAARAMRLAEARARLRAPATEKQAARVVGIRHCGSSGELIF